MRQTPPTQQISDDSVCMFETIAPSFHLSADASLVREYTLFSSPYRISQMSDRRFPDSPEHSRKSEGVRPKRRASLNDWRVAGSHGP